MITKICKVCGKSFECYEKGKRNKIPDKRQSNAVTCSKECSKKNRDYLRKESARKGNEKKNAQLKMRKIESERRLEKENGVQRT